MSEQIVIIWGVLQPLIIHAVARKRHGWIKYASVVLISMLSGALICFVDGLTLKELPLIVLKLIVYSLGAWGGVWKKVFPNKDNPLTAEDEGKGEEWAITYDNGEKVLNVQASSLSSALLTASYKLDKAK